MLQINVMTLTKPTFPAPGHDHGRCTEDSMIHAEQVCARRAQKFTPIRRHVLQALLSSQLSQDTLDWLKANYFKTELELGHCLRTPAEGPCECDLVLTCSKFLTTSDYAPRLRARLDVEQQLIDDATARGWQREIERHTATKTRIVPSLVSGEPITAMTPPDEQV